MTEVLTRAINKQIFRTYDIRGIVDETLFADDMRDIGLAIGSQLRELGEHQLCVGRDGRLSSPELIKPLIAGLVASGCCVIDLGIVPTPLLYYGAQLLPSRSGIMLTGSHNPGDYNGVKAVIRGQALTEYEIKNIYQRIVEKNFMVGVGSQKRLSVYDAYLKDILSDIHLNKELHIVVDAGNGMAGEIAPRIFSALGCKVHTLYGEIDGRFPNHHPDPSQAENLQNLIEAVLERKADIGLAFDGDADRIGVVTNQGEIIWSDRLLMIYARELLQKIPAAKIVFDVKCTNDLPALIDSLGGEAVMYKTGHSHIKAKMAEIGALLGGEMSGHFFFKDRWYGFDDALYAAARLLEILAKYDGDAHQLFQTIPNSFNTPELKIPVADEKKFLLMEKLISKANFNEANEVLSIDGLRVNFSNGWGLLRPSNTTPFLILRFEAKDKDILEKIQTIFRNWMLSVDPTLSLPF